MFDKRKKTEWGVLSLYVANFFGKLLNSLKSVINTVSEGTSFLVFELAASRAIIKQIEKRKHSLLNRL